MGIGLRDRAQLEIINSVFLGGATVDATEKTRVTLDRAKAPGEIVIAPGADVTVTDSSSVLLWLYLGAQARGRFALPDGSQLDDWSSGLGLNVRVRNSQNIMWGVISASGSDCIVENSHLLGAGLYIAGDTRVAFEGIHNKGEIRAFDASGVDRKLRFENCKVDAWNFYAEGKAHVTLSRCTFGEALGLKGGSFLVRDSTCDGSGGYVGSEGASVMTFSNCKLMCRVIAREESSLILENCAVDGDIHAASSATVKLIKTTTRGRVDKDPGAKVIRE